VVFHEKKDRSHTLKTREGQRNTRKLKERGARATRRGVSERVRGRKAETLLRLGNVGIRGGQKGKVSVYGIPPGRNCGQKKKVVVSLEYRGGNK